MRTAITLGYPRGGGVPKVLFNIDTPILAQRQFVRELASTRTNAEYERLEVWTSDAIEKRAKFQAPTGTAEDLTPEADDADEASDAIAPKRRGRPPKV